MKRQGLITTIEELRQIADELEEQLINATATNKFQLNIINKSGLSDEWKFENSEEKKQ